MGTIVEKVLESQADYLLKKFNPMLPPSLCGTHIISYPILTFLTTLLG